MRNCEYIYRHSMCTVIGIDSAKRINDRQRHTQGSETVWRHGNGEYDEKAEKLKIQTNNDSLIGYHRRYRYVVVRCGGFCQW